MRIIWVNQGPIRVNLGQHVPIGANQAEQCKWETWGKRGNKGFKEQLGTFGANLGKSGTIQGLPGSSWINKGHMGPAGANQGQPVVNQGQIGPTGANW